MSEDSTQGYIESRERESRLREIIGRIWRRKMLMAVGWLFLGAKVSQSLCLQFAPVAGFRIVE